MGQLLDIYNELTAPEQEKVAEESVEELETLAKYAELADNLMKEEYGDDYEAADVEKLATLLIEQAQEESEMIEKIAEIDDFATIVAEKVAAMLTAEE